MSPSRFDFRISVASMAVLFFVSALCTLGIRYGAISGWVPVDALFKVFSFDTAMFILALLRGLVIFIIAILPFGLHIVERPSLTWTPIGVSFAGTILPWLVLGTLNRGMVITIILSHMAALALLGLLWRSMNDAVEEIQKSTTQPA